MKLTERQKWILREIYQVNLSGNFVVSSGSSGTLFSYELKGQSIQQRLEEAITFIDTNSAIVQRVGEIVQKYDEISLRPGDIERNGFSLTNARLMSSIYRMLFPYTGIQWQSGSGNAIHLG